MVMVATTAGDSNSGSDHWADGKVRPIEAGIEVLTTEQLRVLAEVKSRQSSNRGIGDPWRARPNHRRVLRGVGALSERNMQAAAELRRAGRLH